MGLCNLKHVKQTNDCSENPGGTSNYCMVVPIDSDHIEGNIEINDEKNQYNITPKGGSGSTLKGFKIAFKNQSGQVSSEDNGEGSANTVTGTGLVDKNEDDMAVLGRRLSNMGGGYMVFFPTGKTKKVNGVSLKEWKVVGNPTGDVVFSRTNDSGKNRNDEHGTTFNFVCNFQVYDVVKYYGEIAEDVESDSSN